MFLCVNVYERKYTEVKLGGQLSCCSDSVHLWAEEWNGGGVEAACSLLFNVFLNRLTFYYHENLLIYYFPNKNIIRRRNGSALGDLSPKTTTSAV